MNFPTVDAERQSSPPLPGQDILIANWLSIQYGYSIPHCRPVLQ